MEYMSTNIDLFVGKEIIQNLVLEADKVVSLVTGYKLWIITCAKVLISGENGIVFIDDFFGVPPSALIISSVDPYLSSYCISIGYEGGRTSKKILNNFPCNHKFFVPYLALDTISVYNSIGEELPYDL